MKIALLAALFLAGNSLIAQSSDVAKPKEDVKFYKLDFVVKDMDEGKVVTARNYSIIVQTGDRTAPAQVRAGSRIAAGAQGQMFDVGTNIDCSSIMQLDNNDVSFRVQVEVSSLLSETDLHPIVRQNKWNSNVIIPLKKPTIIFSSDDATTKHVLQLEVTATPRPL